MKDCSSVKCSFGGVRLALFLFVSFFFFFFFIFIRSMDLFSFQLTDFSKARQIIKELTFVIQFRRKHSTWKYFWDLSVFLDWKERKTYPVERVSHSWNILSMKELCSYLLFDFYKRKCRLCSSDFYRSNTLIWSWVFIIWMKNRN